MSAVTVTLLLAAVLVAICGGLPARTVSVIYFPEDEVVPRFSDRPPRRHPAVSRGFFFPDELPERSAPVGPAEERPNSAVEPDRPAPPPDAAGPDRRATTDRTAPTRPPPPVPTSPTPAVDRADGAVIVDPPAPRPPHQRPPPPTRRPADSSIEFVDRPTAPLPPLPECGGEFFKAYNNATGNCQQLASADNCPAGYWFVLDRGTQQAGCRPRPCPADHWLFDGDCRPADGDDTCPAGMASFIDQYGHGLCDCRSRQAFWPAEWRCYPVYRRGPCDAGLHFVFLNSTGEARCVPTPCPDGEVFWDEGGVSGGEDGVAPPACYPLANETSSPCLPGRLDVDPFTLELKCNPLKLLAIFDPPKVRCAKGSMLDFQGQCRKELFQKFRSTFAAQTPESRSLCPPGFTAAPDGRCVNKALTGGALG